MKRAPVILAILVCSVPLITFAQSDGTVPRDSGSLGSSGADLATSSLSAPAPAPAPTPSGAPRATSTPRLTTPVSGSRPSKIETIATSTEAPEEVPEDGANLLISGALATLLCGGLAVLFFIRGNAKNADTNVGKCDTVHELLEQKRRELEMMMKEWPEEKLKSLATEALLTEAKKDPRIGARIAAGQKAHQEITSLQKKIAVLQSRFDLCMLSLHMPGAREYEGALIESSLVDTAVLEHVHIVEKRPRGTMQITHVEVSEKQIEKLGDQMNDGPWHMRFKKRGTETGYIVFKERRFPIDYANESSWHEARAYGTSLGIPKGDLEFARAW